MTVALDVDGLWVRTGSRAVVAGVALSARGGELVALVGPSGCGKSTLLRALCGRLSTTFERSAAILRWTVSGAHAPEPLLGRVVVHVPQEAGVALNPYARVGAQVSRAALGDVGMDDVLADRVARAWPHELSGGTAERVAVAQALALGTPALLVDEPTTGLDPLVRGAVSRALRAAADAGRLVVVVTHDRPGISRVADRILAMRLGRVGAA